jgi:DNA-binding MarR family transcriptional regulator
MTAVRDGSTPGSTNSATGTTGTTPAAPRWLTDDEQRVWRRIIPVLHELPAAIDRQLQVDAGIPHAYYVILAMLSEAPGRELRMTELSQVTATSLSRLSHAVARLQEYGWVERRRCPTDRRGQIAALTEAGRAKVTELAPGHVEAVQRFVFDALTPEQVEQLGVICDAITTAVAHDERRPAG